MGRRTRTAAAAVAAAALVVTGACSRSAGTTASPTDPPEDRQVPDLDNVPDFPGPDRRDDPPGEPDDPDGSGGSGGSEDPDGSDGGCDESPVWAVVGQPATDCDEPTEGPTPEPELGTGDVQITLRWTSAADIDLHVFEPGGTEISYSDPGPTASGGRLDVDSNVGCEQEASVENVFWPEGDMPVGGYRVVVHGYDVEGCGSGDYTVTANVRGQPVLEETGTVGEEERDEYAFDAG